MLTLVLLLLAQTTSPLPSVDPRAKDVVDLFEKACVEHAGDAAFASQFATPGIGRAMTQDELLRTNPAGSSTSGWIIRSPSDGWAALFLTPSMRTCSVQVREAEPAQMKTLLYNALTAFYDRMGAKVSVAKPDEIETVGGVIVHRSSWLVDLAGHQLAIIASIGDKPIGAHQHLMTFTLLH